MHKFTKFSLFSFVIVACLMVSVKLCTSTAYASAGDFAMYLGYYSTSGHSIGTVIDFDSWDDFRNGLPVGFEPCYDSFKGGNVSLSSPVYALSPSDGGNALCDISSFRLVSYNASYYVIAFTAVPDRSGALSNTFYLADNLGRLYAVDKSGKFTYYLHNIDLNTDGIEDYIDTVESKLATLDADLDKINSHFTYTTGGVAYSIANRCYYISQKLDALDSLSSIQTILSNINSHFTYTTGGTSYSIANRCYYIGRRLDDILTAIGNQSVSVNLKDLNLTLDTSHIDISANTSYCIVSLADSSGTDYDYTVIPYDTAVSMLSRLNTDYIGDSINQLTTDGLNTYSRTVLDANLTEDGFIMVNTTNGRHYYLCNSSRMIYHIDPTTNYCLIMSQTIDTQSAAILDKLDVINESINDIDIEAEVIQNIQQYDTDVDDGVSVISKILHLVRGFFNPGISVEWNDARGYAMNWGNDS